MTRPATRAGCATDELGDRVVPATAGTPGPASDLPGWTAPARPAWTAGSAPPPGRAADLLLDPGRHQEGDDGGVDVGQLAHDLDDAVGGLVVEDPAPGLAVGAAGQQHADLGLAVGQLGRQLERGPAEAAVRAVDDVERQAGQPEALPALHEHLGPAVCRC